MNDSIEGAVRRLARFWRDQTGITGLETAIVLIAFVVVAAVFAFAVLSTGLLSSEKSKETVLGGLEETAATIVLRGAVIAHRSGSLDEIEAIEFQMTNASQSGEGVDLSTSGTAATIVTYIDDNQVVNLSGTTDWLATWIIGSSDVLTPGERVQIRVTLTGLATKLAPSTDFTIQVKPTVGSVLVIEKTTPAEFKTVMNLN